MNRAYPPELREAELKALRERREAAGEAEGPAARQVGFGISGGGVRSATFALGVFQALARARLIRKIDFLSTVSGGGYFGSFLGRLFTRTDAELNEAGALGGKSPVEKVESIVQNSQSPPLHWLRENGRYLAPNGSGDTLLGTTIILRSWVAIHVVIATLLLSLFTLADLCRALAGKAVDAMAGLPSGWLHDVAEILRRLAPGLPTGWIWWSPYLVVPAMLMGFAVIPLGWSAWVVPYKLGRSDTGRGVPHLLVVLCTLFVSCGVLVLKNDGFEMPSVPAPLLWFLAIESFFTLLWSGVAFWHARNAHEKHAFMKNWLDHALANWFAFTLALLAFALINSLGQTVYACVSYGQVSAGKWLGAIGAGLFTLVAAGQKIAVLFAAKHSRSRLTVPAGIVAGVAGVSLAAFLLIALSAVAHGAAWGWHVPKGNPGKLIAQHVFPDSTSGETSRIDGPPQEPAKPDNRVQLPYMQDPTEGAHYSATATFGWSVTLLFVSFIFGYTWPFLNQSSQQALYNARIARTYLGASNPRRWRGGGTSVTRVIDGDGITLADYAPHRRGGPLHLINVTINETVDARSQIEQRDRKGTGMAVGPCGVSVGVVHHAVWYSRDKQLLPPFYEGRFQVFQDENRLTRDEADQFGRRCKPIDVEPLVLGQWVGISGAAFSTGLGARTSIGLSLLAGIFDIRLGYWWNSGVDPVDRGAQCPQGAVRRFFRWLTRVFPVQMYLLDEFTARFYGTARKQWYLTDGGHFENMGGYELIRRRVDLMVICDGEQDAEFTFQGLADFVRKARTDFSAEIEFFTHEELDNYVDPSVRRHFGTLEQMRRGEWTREPVRDPATGIERLSVDAEDERLSLAHAALAWVRYRDESPPETPQPPSVLLYIKASLTGDEPEDLLNYHKCCPDFPHQTTANQFFDEAQWESYRRLGEHIGTKLFATDQPPTSGKWVPSSLDPAPLLAPAKTPAPTAPKAAKPSTKRA
jgi:hypothetical protein